MLISGSHNASIGNKPFSHKVKSYNQNPLLNQQAEIKDYATIENEDSFWKSGSILKRHNYIVEFATRIWNFDNINLDHLKEELEELEKLEVQNISELENKLTKTKSNGKLLIELNPKLESDFKQLLLEKKQAYIKTFYKNGTFEERIWKANNFKESSGVMGNLRSRPEFRSGKWEESGIEKYTFQ